jgi:hypothetical protein
MLPKDGVDLVLRAMRTPGSRPGRARNGFHSPILPDLRADRMTGPPDGYIQSPSPQASPTGTRISNPDRGHCVPNGDRESSPGLRALGDRCPPPPNPNPGS